MPSKVRFLLCGAWLFAGAAPVAAQPAGEDSPPPAPPAAEGAPAAEPPAAGPTPAAPGPAAPARVVISPTAKAQLSEADQARADALEAEGNQLYAKGQYKEAISRFQQALDISGNPKLLYSIAISYQQLQAWQECVTHMDRYLEQAPPGPKRDRAGNTRTSCDARIERDQLLTIESDPVGARVFLDDREKGVVGTTPFRNYLRPGPHAVWVELDGYEPIRQDIEVQRKEPFRMNIAMRRIRNLGFLYVDSTIIGATVFIDGKNIGLTPFKEPLAYAAGRHQVVVDRDGYTRFDKHVSVEKGATTVVDAYVVRTDYQGSWRSPVGWTANVIGLLTITGGVVAWQLAEREFNDTDKFKTLALYEKLGYGIGGGLMALGTTLIIWDRSRDVVLDKDRNPGYGRPVQPPAKSLRPLPFAGRDGLGLGFSF